MPLQYFGKGLCGDKTLLLSSGMVQEVFMLPV